MRYLIRFSYDGFNFYGFQKQPDLRTVEEELEKALFSINNHKNTKVVGSGRTDRGVHARGQSAHFDLAIDITLEKLKRALNSLLPEDIHVFSTEVVDKDFHARYMAKQKTYEYILNTGEYDPITRNHIYQLNKKLNLDLMTEAIEHFKGTHDFKSFVSNEAIKDNYVRTIYEAEIRQEKDLIIFSFTGSGFMKYQVRNMVGTLIKIGLGKLDPSIVDEIFTDSDAEKYVYTAKSQGLYLVDVKY